MTARKKTGAKRRRTRRPRIHAVVLAGGVGERFWPASRRHRPKQFLSVVGEQTLFEATLARARRFAAEEDVWIVCGSEHVRTVRRQSGLPASRVLVEPRRRNTAMAVAWAAHRIAATDSDAVMVVLPADHHVPDVRAFARDIRVAARAAHRAGVLVTLGVAPTRPEVGYGYIQTGPLAKGFPRVHEVRRFVEKPNAATARRYVRRGDYRWNAGIFIWSASVLLREIERWEPALHRSLAPFRTSPRAHATRKWVDVVYRRAPSLPIDVAVMERSDRVWTLPVDFAWSDVGTWESLADQLGVGTRGRGSGEAAGNRVLGGPVLLDDARDNLVWSEGRLVALLGVEDLVVVDTGDVILVTKRNASPDVRRLVRRLREQGGQRLT